MRYLIVLILLGSHLFSAQNLEKVTLQLKWYHQFQFAGYYVAKEKGFYRDAGLDVEIKERELGNKIIDEVLDKRANYGVGGSSLILERVNGKKIAALAAVFQSSPVVLVTLEHSGIFEISDMDGKRFYGRGGTNETAAVSAMLLNRGITFNQVDLDKNKSSIEHLIDGNVDVVAVYKSNELYTLAQKGVRYRVFSPKNHGYRFYSDILFTSEYEAIEHKERTLRFKDASLKGWEYAFLHIEETIELIRSKYNSQNKTYAALMHEAIELKTLAYYGVDHIGTIDKEKVHAIYESYRSVGATGSRKLEVFIVEADDRPVQFTEEEKEYLLHKKEITICGRSNWKPYMDFSGPNPVGVLPEMMDELRNLIGTPINYVKTANWKECVEKVTVGEIDIVDVILTKQNMHRRIIPTVPHSSDFLVLATKLEMPYINNISTVDYLNVTILDSAPTLHTYVRTYYPNLNLIPVKSLSEGLEKVSNEDADAYMGIFIPTTFAITKEYAKEIKINGRFQEVALNGSFGVRDDNAILLGILDKGVSKFDPKIKREILNSWISVKQEDGFDYSFFWKIVSALIFGVSLLLYRQYILKRENKKLQSAYRRIQKQQVTLREQKHIHQLIFNNAIDGVLIVKNGKFTDCNSALLKMMKYDKKEEFLKQDPLSLSPKYQPDGSLSAEKAEMLMNLTFKNSGHRFEWIILKATGEAFWTEIVLTPIVTENQKMLHVVWKDIDQRKRLEFDHEALKEQLELAFTGSRDGLWDWNLITDEIYFSPRWKEMLGYSDDELENSLSVWEERVHPDDLPHAKKEIQRNIDGETDMFENKHRLKHKDGHWVWIYDRGKTLFEGGKAVRMIGTHTDLTTEINLTKELSTLNDSLEAQIEEAVSDMKKAQEQAKLGSWKFDIINKRLLWSDETYNIFGLTNSSEISTYHDFLKAIHPDDRKKVDATYQNSLESKENYEIVHRLLMPDGRVKYVKEQCETNFDAEGNALESIGTIQDITLEHTTTEKLRQKEKQLLRQSRLAQMGEMISMIAHQWRQPLTAISTTTASLGLKIEGDGYDKIFFQSRLNRISSYVKHLSSTIEDFRNFFQPDKERQETTFIEIVDNALGFVAAGLESKNITIQRESHCEGTIFTYPNEVLQVILNLIKNAEDALLENNSIDAKIIIRCSSDSKHAVLEVEDNAGGIDIEIIGKVFDPYFTTKDEHNGTGLGLYMSKIIIEEHCAGQLTVHNSKSGAIFKIEFGK